MDIGTICGEKPANLDDELFESLFADSRVTIERIVSRGHISPKTGWHDQAWHEWVMVVKGRAVLSFPDRDDVVLTPGDYVNLPPHCRHRVSWTDPDNDTIWLAVHCRGSNDV